jgi:hypothetical protein
VNSWRLKTPCIWCFSILIIIILCIFDFEHFESISNYQS